MDTLKLRDTILNELKNKNTFGNMTAAEINGNYFSAADIAFTGTDGKHEVYRIAVIKH